MNCKVAGTVVLFNPEADVLENILSYCHTVKKLYVIDNSEQKPSRLLHALSSKANNIEYISLGRNFGIAKALNTAATKAREEGYNWLLTMDQDSYAINNIVTDLLKALDIYPATNIGILAPEYIPDNSITTSANFEEVLTVITSGNLLNLEAFSKVGPFREDFFIDYVDHEYCLRLNLNGYKVIKNKEVLINHKLGNSQEARISGIKFTPSHHSARRRYYITRNRLAVLKEYKKQFPHYWHLERSKNLRELIKIILFERNKAEKIYHFLLGYLDFKRNKFGEFS